MVPQDSAFLEVWDAVLCLALAIMIVLLPYSIAFLDFPTFDGSRSDKDDGARHRHDNPG